MDLPDEALLLIEGGPDNEEAIPVVGPTTTLGRQSSNDVVVAETGVSRKHAEIVQEEGGYYLRDLSTTNGTFVNRKKIGEEDHPLKDGDSIRLGASEVSLVFHSPMASTLQLTLVQSAIHDVPDGAEESEGPTKPLEEPPANTRAVEVPGATGDAADDEALYEGTVRLNVQTQSNMGLVVNFTQRLREQPEFRLLRLSKNRKGGVDVWLALREPVSLRRLLSTVEGVVAVSLTRGRDLSPESADSPLTLTLGGEDSTSSPSG